MPLKYAPQTALVLTFALAGCDVNIHNGKASVGVVSAEATSEWTHQYPLAAGGQVGIVNINGPVEITGGAAGTVEVHAIVTAKTLTDSGARDILTKGQIQEIAEPARVHIETMLPRGIRGSYVVQYDVRVPPGARTEVSTTSGSLKVTGLAGTLKATTINGKMELENIGGGIDCIVASGSLITRLDRVAAPIRLEVTNGSLVLNIPSDSKAHLSARVINGAMALSGLKVDQPTGRRIRVLDVLLNGGGPDILTNVTNGRLSIEGK